MRLLNSKTGPRGTLTVLVVGLTFALAVVIGLYLSGFDAVAAVRDGGLSTRPEAGLISNLGIALMALAGLTALVGAVKASSIPLGVLGLFCCLFTLDDALMIHEQLGAWEFLAFATHGALAVLTAYLFWTADERLPWPILITIGAFAISVVFDVLWGGFVGLIMPPGEASSFLRRAGYILEDVPKFGGILVLTSFAIGETLSRAFHR